jgi:hypothetical protein
VGRRSTDTVGREESKQPLGQVGHGLGRLGSVRLNPGLGQDLLPLSLGNEAGRSLAESSLDVPAPGRVPQEHDEESVLGQAPHGEDARGVRRQVPKRVVPGREVHERHPSPLQRRDEAFEPLAIRALQRLAVVVDRADLLRKGLLGRG